MASQEDGHKAAYETGFEQDLKFITGKEVSRYCKFALLQHWYLVSHLVQHYHIKYVWQI